MLTHFRQRPPVFITAAFAFSVALCYFAGAEKVDFAGNLLIFVCIAAGIASFVLLHRKLIYLALVAVMLISAVTGVLIVRQSAFQELYLQRYVDKNVNLEGIVYRCDYGESSYVVFIKTDKVMGISVKPFNIAVVTDTEQNAPALYDRAVYNVDIKRPDSGLYTQSQADIYRSRKIFITGSGTLIAVKSHARGIYALLKKVQDAMKGFIDRLFYSELFKALVTGDRNDLSVYDRNLFAQAGISHVLALSGLHISVILAFFRKGFNMFSAPRAVYHAGTVVVMLFYMAMTGFSYSVMRAGIMTFFCFVSVELYNRYDALNGICTALFVILLIDPYAVGDVSLQLSFFATLGIIAFAVPLMKRLEKRRIPEEYYTMPLAKRAALSVLNAVRASLIITFSVTLFTLPVMIMRYGNVGVTAFLSNIVAVPMVSLIVTALLFYIILSFFHGGTALHLGNAIDAFAGIFYKSVRFFAGLGLPEYKVMPEIKSVFGAVLVVILVFMVLFNVRAVCFFAVAVVVALAGVIIFCLTMWNQVSQVHYLDYTDTQTAIFRKNGCVTVYCMRGDDAYAVRDFCRQYNISVIDEIIVPIPQDDFRKYFDGIISDGIKIEKVLHCPIYTEDIVKSRYEKYFVSHSAELEYFNYGDTVYAEGLSFELTAHSFYDYEMKADFCGKRLYFSVNSSPDSLYPVCPEGDICVLYGEGWYIPNGNDTDYEIIMAQEDMHQFIPDTRNLYKIPRSAGCIFGLGGKKISMRSIG